MSALAVAAAGGDRELVEMLLKSGAYIDAQDNFGLTALMWAVTKRAPGSGGVPSGRGGHHRYLQ